MDNDYPMPANDEDSLAPGYGRQQCNAHKPCPRGRLIDFLFFTGSFAPLCIVNPLLFLPLPHRTLVYKVTVI